MFIAFKEIRRAAGRFTLLIGAVALLVLLLLFFQAVAGTLTSGLTGGVEQNGSDVWVYDERARNNPNVSVLSLDTVESIAEVAGVADAAPIGLSVFAAIDAGASDGEIEVVIVGGDTDGTGGPATLSGGERPAASGEAIFSGASFDADFELGQQIEVEGQTITVVGIADDAAFNVLPTFYVSFETYAAAILERSGFETPASVIGVSVNDDVDVDEVIASIESQVDGVSALSRADAVNELPGVGRITQSFSILYFLLYVVVTIVTGVFFLILTVQKARSLVLLRAIGASQIDVVKPVMVQVLVVVGAGAAIGSAAASGLLYLSRDTFGAELDTRTITMSIAIVMVLGLAASVGAVRRVLRIDPIDATKRGGAAA